MRKKTAIIVASVPDRERTVVEFWVENHQWGEANDISGEITLEIYTPNSSHWELSIDDVIECLVKAREILRSG